MEACVTTGRENASVLQALEDPPVKLVTLIFFVNILRKSLFITRDIFSSNVYMIGL